MRQPPHGGWSGRRGATAPAAAGTTIVELVATLAALLVVYAITVPAFTGGRDRFLTAGAAHHLSGRLQQARADAVKRGAHLALRFLPDAGGTHFSVFADGNRNGVRTSDINRGVDRQVEPWEQLSDHFAGVEFAIGSSVTDVETGAPISGDPLRLGGSDMLSFGPAGTATSGTLYLRGRGGTQYAVRILGATGRVRVLRFEMTSSRWMPA